MAKLTEKAIMKTFIDLLNERSMDKITVKDIIEEIGINRNTFYYHYEDIYDLIDNIFQEEVNAVSKKINEDTSFYEVYLRAAHLFIENKQAIIHLFDSKSRDVVERYIQKVIGLAIERFVRQAASKYEIEEEGIEFITYFYTAATFAQTIDWIKKGMPAYNKDFIKILSSSFEATIEPMIINYVKNA